MLGRDIDAYELQLTSHHGRVWEQRPKISRDGVICRAVNGHKRPGEASPVAFQAAAFSGDGQTCAAADKRGHLYILYLSLNRFSLLSRGDGSGPPPGCLCFTNRRTEEVLAAAGATVKAFDLHTHRPTAILQGHKREVRSVSSSGSAGVVLTQSADLAILWDVKDWTRKRTLQAVTSPLQEAHFSPSGELCGLLFRDSRVALWRLSTMAFEQELVAPDGLLPVGAPREALGLKHFAISGRRLLAGGSCGLLMWSLTRPERLPLAIDLPGAVARIQLGRIDLDRTGQVVEDAASEVAYILQDDGQVLVACLKSLEVVLHINLETWAVLDFHANTDAKYLLLACSNGTLEVRDLPRSLAAGQRTLEQRIQLGVPTHMLKRVLKRRDYTAEEKAEELPKVTDEAAWGGPEVSGQTRVSTAQVGGRATTGRSHRSAGQPMQGQSSTARSSGLSSRPGPSRPPPVTTQPQEPPPKEPQGAEEPVWALAGAQQVPLPATPSSTSQGPAEQAIELEAEERMDSLTYRNFLRRISGMLRRRGDALPDAQRPRLWRKVLQLPYNREAYAELEALGLHPAFSDLRARYPAHTKHTLGRLERLLSALAHWSPLWAEAPFLPALAFPFLKVFGDEPVLCFEAVLCVLLGWARRWADGLPGPPVPELLRLDDLLAGADPMLHHHLKKLCEEPEHPGGAVHRILWPLLHTLMTEVFQKAQWLHLWDHLVANWLEPELLHAAVVASLMTHKAALLAIPPGPGASETLEDWLREPRQVHMPQLLEKMYALRADAAALAPQGLGPDPLLEGLAGLGDAQLPLPQGRYPKVFALPHMLPDPRSQVKPEAGAKDAESLHRMHLLEIHSAVERLARDDARFRQQQEELLGAEEERRRLAAAEEERLLEERRRADERLLQRRLQQVRQLFEGMEQSLKQQQEARATEGQQLLEDLRRRHRQRSYELEARLKEEAVLNLEAKGAQAVSELLRKRRDEEGTRALQADVRARRRAMDLQDEIQRQEWLAEDERERARLEALRQHRLRIDSQEAEMRRRREVEMELQLEEFQRQLQKSQVDRERILRKAQQDAEQVREVAEELSRRRHELKAREEQRVRALAVAEERRRQKELLEERQRLVEQEMKRWRLDLDSHEQQLGEEALEQLRQEYDLRTCQVQEEAREQDAAAQELLRETLLQTDSLRRAATGVADSLDRGQPMRGPETSVQADLSNSAAQREQELEELIRQREAELEALWHEFDAEARELSQLEMEVGAPAASSAAPAAPMDAVSPGGGRAAASRGGLAAPWDDSSEEESVAVRRVVNPPGEAVRSRPQ